MEDRRLTSRHVLSSLTMNALKPRGWWLDYLRRIADGWMLRIARCQHDWYYSPFWERSSFDKYPDDVRSEEAGYFADAIIRLSLLAPDTALARELDQWLDRVLASQDEDGYLGCCKPQHRWKGPFELWAQDRMLQALIWYYEQTGEEKVLQSCLRAARCIERNLHKRGPVRIYSTPLDSNPFAQWDHTLNIIHPLLKLYEYCGVDAFRELAVELHDDFDRSGSPVSASALLSHDATWCHIVTLCEHFSIPISIYAVTGDERLRDASLAGVRHWMKEMYQVTGVLAGNEFTAVRGPRKCTEHCGIIEWAISCDRILDITGDVSFADAAERAMLNAYPGSRSPDGLTVAYNHAPNELYAADWAYPYEEDFDRGFFRAHYSMVHEPRCCNGNTSRGWPNYVSRAVKTTLDGGVAFVYYGPLVAEVELPVAGKVRFEQETHYPFEDHVTIYVHPQSEVHFPLVLRIPCWCRGASVSVNGSHPDGPAKPGTFHRVERRWRNGDTLELRFDIPITLDIYATSSYAVPGVAVVRGPLVFCLPVPQEWIYTGASPAHPDNVGESWNVIPRRGAAWNYALELDLDRPESRLALTRLEVPDGSIPWEHPPVGIRARARRVHGWRADTINGKPYTPALPAPPLRVASKAEEITLVPFGSTRLRMTYLPVIGEEKLWVSPWREHPDYLSPVGNGRPLGD